MTKLELKNYSRELSPTTGKKKSTYSKTINISETNSQKLLELNIFLSKLVRDYLDKNTNESLKAKYSNDLWLKNNENRIVSSVLLRDDHKKLLKGVNINVLIDELISSL